MPEFCYSQCKISSRFARWRFFSCYSSAIYFNGMIIMKECKVSRRVGNVHVREVVSKIEKEKLVCCRWKRTQCKKLQQKTGLFCNSFFLFHSTNFSCTAISWSCLIWCCFTVVAWLFLLFPRLQYKNIFHSCWTGLLEFIHSLVLSRWANSFFF